MNKYNKDNDIFEGLDDSLESQLDQLKNQFDQKITYKGKDSYLTTEFPDLSNETDVEVQGSNGKIAHLNVKRLSKMVDDVLDQASSFSGLDLLVSYWSTPII